MSRLRTTGPRRADTIGYEIVTRIGAGSRVAMSEASRRRVVSDSEQGGTLMRYAGIAGATIGVLAAGAAAGVLAERKLVARASVPTAAEAFGSVCAAIRHTVVADDGLELYAEVDERRPTPRDRPVRPTIVFVHGYALNLDCWHFQRLALRGRHRLVLYDQRSHGRSGRSRAEHCTIDQLGRRPRRRARPARPPTTRSSWSVTRWAG